MTTKNDFMSILYDSSRDKIETAFTRAGVYRPPSMFEHGAWHSIATCLGDGDGKTVTVEECRVPARFYRLVVDGRTVAETGSGADQLTYDMATAIANGMLALK